MFFWGDKNFLIVGIFLPAATKLGQGSVFTSVCLSTGREGCLPQYMLGYPPRADPPTPRTSHPPPQSRQPPRTRHPPGSRPSQDQTHPPRADTPQEQTPPQTRHPPPPPREADCSIRLTSGRYASYWNAFLFSG